MSNTNLRNPLTIKATTWYRDSHGLFDYESKSININLIKIYEEGYLLRTEDEIIYNPSLNVENIEFTPILCYLGAKLGKTYLDGNYYIKSFD